jgi:hypothetical protein
MSESVNPVYWCVMWKRMQRVLKQSVVLSFASIKWREWILKGPLSCAARLYLKLGLRSQPEVTVLTVILIPFATVTIH